jgi:hypothetical protein
MSDRVQGNGQYLYGDQVGRWAVLECPDEAGMVPPPFLPLRDHQLLMLGTPSDILTRLANEFHRQGPIQQAMSRLLGVSQGTVSTCINGGGRLRLMTNRTWQSMVQLYFRPELVRTMMRRISSERSNQ